MLSLILAVGVAAVYLANPACIQTLELKALDFRFQARGVRAPGGDVAVVAIDEASLSELGRWPWPRNVTARLVEALEVEGAKTVVFDLGFFEPDQTDPHNDQMLAEAVGRGRPQVVLGYYFQMAPGPETVTPEEIGRAAEGIVNGHYSMVPASAGAGYGPPRAVVPQPNLPLLSEAAVASGYFNIFPDSDGAVRAVPLAIWCLDKYFLPISLQAVRDFSTKGRSALELGTGGVDAVRVDGHSPSVDRSGFMYLNYLGPSGTVPRYSAADVMAGRLTPGALEGRIVFIGPTAAGLGDIRVTPFDPALPGVEIHATAADNILHRNWLSRPRPLAVDLGTIFFLALLLGWVAPRLHPLGGPVFSLFVLIALVGGNYYMFRNGYWFNLVYPLITFGAVYTVIITYAYIILPRPTEYGLY